MLAVSFIQLVVSEGLRLYLKSIRRTENRNYQAAPVEVVLQKYDFSAWILFVILKIFQVQNVISFHLNCGPSKRAAKHDTNTNQSSMLEQ